MRVLRKQQALVAPVNGIRRYARRRTNLEATHLCPYHATAKDRLPTFLPLMLNAFWALEGEESQQPEFYSVSGLGSQPNESGMEDALEDSGRK